MSPAHTWAHTNPIPPPPAAARGDARLVLGSRDHCSASQEAFLGKKKGISANKGQYSQLGQADQSDPAGQWGLGDPVTKKKCKVSVRSRVTNSSGKGEFLQHNLH